MAGNWGESAIRAFSTVSDVLNKRELLARDEADRKIKEEERVKNQPLVDAIRAEALNKARRDAAQGFTEDKWAGILQMETTPQSEWTPDQESSLLEAGQRSTYFRGALTGEDLTHKIDDALAAKQELVQIGPQMAGKEGYIDQIQAPKLFDYFNRSEDVNKGTDDQGHSIADGVKKEIVRGYFTSQGVVPYLKVTRPDRSSYFAPATAGRGPSGDEPVLLIKPELVGAKLDAVTRVGAIIKKYQLKYGDTVGMKNFVAAHKPALESAIYSDTLGETADYLEANPNATTNQVNTFIGKTAGRKAEELGIPLPIALADKIMDRFKGEGGESNIQLADGTILKVKNGVVQSTAYKPAAMKEGAKGEAERVAEMTPEKRAAVVAAKRELERPAADRPPKPPTKAEVQRREVEFGKQLVPALAEFYPDLLGSKNIGDFSTKLTPAHKKAINTGRKMLKEGSTPGEAADAVVEALGPLPEPPQEESFLDKVNKVGESVGRALGFYRKDKPSPESSLTQPSKKKTVKLPDGKSYKDGDIYTDPKTKQKSIVRVK